MNALRIPRCFRLFGQEYTVEWDASLCAADNAVGHFTARNHKIRLQPHSDLYPRPQSDIERVFLHELIHACLESMSYDDLGRDERFVDTFARLLHQAFTTSEYDDAQ